jgi:hypothetical protein
MSDPFCPRHGRASRPIEVPGLRCDCGLRRVEIRLSPIEVILANVLEERARQDKKFPGHSIAAPSLTDGTRLRIIVEEVGEVAEAMDTQHANTKRDLRAELVQVAACAVGWLEALDQGERE